MRFRVMLISYGDRLVFCFYICQTKVSITTRPMAIKITDECINCGACEPECPNTAIYEAAAEWKYKEGKSCKKKM